VEGDVNDSSEEDSRSDIEEEEMGGVPVLTGSN
jgi:hypothetical protein